MGLEVTIEDKTVTCTVSWDPYYISVRYWLFSDGTRIGMGEASTSVSHTFESYGNHSVNIEFTVYFDGPSRTYTWSKSFLLEDPNDKPTDGLNSFDVFRNKPIIIPAECTGDIAITALIEELPEPMETDKTKRDSTVTSFLNLTNIELGGGSSITFTVTKDTDKNSTVEGGEITDCDVLNLEFIPAFYSGGEVYCQFSIGETDDDDGKFDIDWDMNFMFPSMPTWYEGNLSYDSQIIKNLINSDNSEVNFPSSAEYTRYDHTFHIDGWSEMPPFELKWYNDTKLGYAIKRACLSPPEFKFTLTNNESSRVLLNNATIRWIWSFNPTDIFMNMRTEGKKRQKRSRLYTLPKGADATRLEGLDYPVYVIADGYKRTDPPEIVKVYAQWNEHNTDGDYYFPTTVLCEPVAGVGGDDDDPDFPSCLFKSIDHKLKSEDFTRIVDGGWMNGDGPIIIDAPTIAESEHYRTINVTIADDKSADDQSAKFIITTIPNDSVDDSITEEELTTHMKTVHFFNTSYEFASTVEVPRSAIDPVFYETLWKTYNKAPVLESIVEEPLYYVNFTINKYPRMVPIYNGRTLEFSDSLTHAADGIRSGKVFFIDGKTPNIINMQNPTKHKYKVKFKVDYEVYKHVYVVTDDDIYGFTEDN